MNNSNSKLNLIASHLRPQCNRFARLAAPRKHPEQIPDKQKQKARKPMPERSKREVKGSQNRVQFCMQTIKYIVFNAPLSFLRYYFACRPSSTTIVCWILHILPTHCYCGYCCYYYCHHKGCARPPHVHYWEVYYHYSL